MLWRWTRPRERGKEVSASPDMLASELIYTSPFQSLLTCACLLYSRKWETRDPLLTYQHGCSFNPELLIRLPNKVNWIYIIY